MQKKKKLWVIIPATIVVFLVVVAGAAFFTLEYYATSKVKQEIDRHIKEVSKHVQVEYDSMGVNWLAWTVYLKKVKLSKPPLPGSITIDKIRVRDLTSIGVRWIPTVVVLDNISFISNDTKIGAQRFSTSFSLSRIPTQEEIAKDKTIFLKNLLTGDVSVKDISYADKKWQVKIGQIETNYAVKKGNYKNSDLKINAMELKREDIDIHFDTFTLDASLDPKDVITHISKNVKNFYLKFPPDLMKSDDFLSRLTKLGYDHIIFDFGLKYDYQPQSKELHTSWDASVENMGRLKAALHWGDFVNPPVPLAGTLSQFLAFMDQVSQAPAKASLFSLKADYQDLGLAPKIIKAEAQSRGVSPEDLIQNLVGNINTFLLIVPLPAKVKEQFRSVTKFLQKPNEIHLALTFQEPLRLKQLEESSLELLFTLLGNTEVTITAK